MDARDEIWSAIVACNTAWLEGRSAETGALFAVDAIMVRPDLAVVRGRDAIVRSFVDYVRDVTTRPSPHDATPSRPGPAWWHDAGCRCGSRYRGPRPAPRRFHAPHSSPRRPARWLL